MRVMGDLLEVLPNKDVVLSVMEYIDIRIKFILQKTNGMHDSCIIYFLIKVVANEYWHDARDPSASSTWWRNKSCILIHDIVMLRRVLCP